MRILKIGLIFFHLAGGAAYAGSFFCEKANQIQIRGINCCLSSINAEKCQQKVFEFPTQTLERIALVKKLAADGKFQEGNYPNCHWNSLYEQGVKEATESINGIFTDFETILIRDFHEVQSIDLKKGDLIVVWFDSIMRDENPETGSKIWSSIGAIPGHSAIYLGDNFVFQKENANSTDFSIQNTDEMLATYQEDYNSKPELLRGKAVLKFYRK
jgi:hypothetical protein